MTARRSIFHVVVSLAAGMSVVMTASTAEANPLARADRDSDAHSLTIAVATTTVVLAEPQPAYAQPQPAGEDLGLRTRSLVVTATAFNSLVGQTDSDPTTAAWGDALSPGMKVIAVSRDLISLGLEHRAAVSIEGLPGEYRVLDKMNRRWSKRIDIYMGHDVDAAIAWGRREVQIRW